MTKQDYRYYYMDDLTRVIFYSDIELLDRPDLIFVGMSQNPNPKMAVAIFVQDEKVPMGYKIRPLS